MPELNRIGIEQERPCCRYSHVHDLRDLNDFAAIVTIGEGSKINPEEQEWRPMAQNREACQHRRLEFLIEQPIADDMLDAVRHHCQRRADEIIAEIFMM